MTSTLYLDACLLLFVCVCVLNEQTNRQVKIVTCIKRLSATILQQVSVHSCALRVESRVSSPFDEDKHSKTACSAE